MIKKYYSLFISILCSFCCMAQSNFEITIFPNDSLKNMSFYVQPLSVAGDTKPVSMTIDGSVLSVTVQPSSTGFYRIVAQGKQRQLFLPVYAQSEGEKIEVRLSFESGLLHAVDTEDNKALSGFNSLLVKNSKQMWNNKQYSDAELLNLLKSYKQYADSIAASPCSDDVKAYIGVWAYNTIYSDCQTLVRMAKKEGKEPPFSQKDLLSDIPAALDNRFAPMFYSSVVIAADAIPYGESLPAQFEHLHKNYKNPAMRSRLSEIVIGRFIKNYDYANDYEGGLQLLAGEIEKYSLDTKYIKEYEKNKAKIKGTPFPSDVVLRDSLGNIVDFSVFKGKYVYIDMWASWCGPCVREVPHLQKLESELNNDDVVFLSISIDTDEAAWKKKMAALNMHGNQLIDKENRLGKALGVRGIPFFVIYDKDGRLYIYSAPRPGQGEGVKKLLEDLH